MFRRIIPGRRQMTPELVEATEAELDEARIEAVPLAHPGVEILREITRGGLAGLVVGVAVAGIGGRLVMRLAALLVPSSAGSITDNGNVIGAVTFAGTAALVLFVGLFFGAVAGSVWVAIAPWLPVRPGRRALVAVPIAIGLGALGLIDGRNPDFTILGHDPAVIGSLVLLVGLFGPALVVVEWWMDRLLPRPPEESGVLIAYVAVAVIGGLLTFAAVMPLFLGSRLVVSGVALLVVGVATLASWRLRLHRQPSTPLGLVATARVALAVATINGLLLAGQEVARALALG